MVYMAVMGHQAKKNCRFLLPGEPDDYRFPSFIATKIIVTLYAHIIDRGAKLASEAKPGVDHKKLLSSQRRFL